MEPSSGVTVDDVEAAQAAGPQLPTRDVLPLDWWFPVLLFCAFALCLGALLRKRHKHLARNVWVSVIGLTLCLGAWYLYPSVSFKGTYAATYEYLGEKRSSKVDIGDAFTLDDLVFRPYHVSPLQRMLWVSLPAGWAEDSIPVNLGWGSISLPMPKVGWIKYKKQPK